MTTPAMQAVVMQDFGGPEVLVLGEVERPEPGPGEVRVKVEAVVINNTRDVLTRSGRHPFSRSVTPPHILGGEHAGIVDAAGEGVDPALVGERVAIAAVHGCGRCEWCVHKEDHACAQPVLIGVHRQGAYAEFAIAPVESALRIPSDLSSLDAAILATTGPVGLAQVEAAAIGEGDVLIVPGAAGALGSMVAELAARRGVIVVGLTRDVDRAGAMPLSVKTLVNVSAGDFEERLREACGPTGAHAVIDNVCVSPVWDACLAVLRTRGRVVISGAMGTAPVTIDPRRLYFSNQSILGVRTGNQATVERFWAEVIDGFRMHDGLVTTFALAEAAEAHRRVEAGDKAGHYALVTDGGLS